MTQRHAVELHAVGRVHCRQNQGQMLGMSALTKLQREIGGGAIGSRPVLAKLMREIAASDTPLWRYGAQNLQDRRRRLASKTVFHACLAPAMETMAGAIVANRI